MPHYAPFVHRLIPFTVMASTRPFQLSSSFLHLPRKIIPRAFSPPPPPPIPPSYSHRLLPLRSYPLSGHHRNKLLSTTSAAATPAAHPWPEWDRFVEKIRSKGYFELASAVAVEDNGDGVPVSPVLANRGIAVDMNMLKNACLKFARERFDILRSLPKEDIGAVVKCGCPNLFRKSVNSAKRLRAFLRLNEADVCNVCNIRASCDRAFVVLHGEDEARTLDVMRILLSYAVNPAALIGAERPAVKVQVQESARKLLSELTKLSETTIDPALPKPSLDLPNQKGPSNRIKTTMRKIKNVRDVEMKSGDWLCSSCNFINFARNVRCLQCEADGPKRVESSVVEKKPGDWTCRKCDFMNYARNRKCFRCMEVRPKRELNPGDWECPECDFVNFRRNQLCHKCSCDRPSNEDSGRTDHVWRKSRNTTKVRHLKFGDTEDDLIDSDNDFSEDEQEEVSLPSAAKRKPSSARKRVVSSMNHDAS